MLQPGLQAILPRAELCPPQIAFPDAAVKPGSVQPWRVLHAGPLPAAIIDAQLAVGMQPMVADLERQDGNPSDAGVLRCWRDFRRWLEVMRAAPWQRAEIFHAHSLAAALAAVRGRLPVVFQFTESVHETAARLQASRSLSWAERFVLARAGAVVVDCAHMKELAFRWGAPSQNVFFIPEPVALAAEDTRPPEPAGDGCAPGSGHCRVFSAVADLRDFAELLAGMALIAGEIPGLEVMVEAPAGIHPRLLRYAQARRVGDCVRLLAPSQRQEALVTADFAIALPPRRNRADNFVAAALARGCALLAADCVAHREVSPGGGGCLWYRAGEALDLAGRCSLLADTPELRRDLGAAGRRLMHDTRRPQVVGERFDAAYRHARRQHSNSVRLSRPALMPACV